MGQYMQKCLTQFLADASIQYISIDAFTQCSRYFMSTHDTFSKKGFRSNKGLFEIQSFFFWLLLLLMLLLLLLHRLREDAGSSFFLS